MIDAVILAGGSGMTPSLQKVYPGITNKSHIVINEKMLVEYVLQATLDCTQVDKIFIIGDEAHLSARIEHENVLILQDMDDIHKNFMRAAGRSRKDVMLVLTADIPLITGEILDDFINSCYGREDIYYPIIEKKTVLDYDMLGVRTYAKLTEGHFTGGNIFLVNTTAVECARNSIRRIFDRRKKVFALVKLFGAGFIMKYILGNLPLADVEKQVESILGCPVKAVVSKHAEIGIDIDKIEDLHLAMRHIEI